MCVNCADAACHTTTKDAESNIINFSAQTWGDSIKQHFTTLNSYNIITFMEINTDKQLDYIKDEFVKICNDIDEILKMQSEKDDDTECYFYKMHDCKFLFMLTKHVQWNRSYHPYLRCKYKKGAGVKNNRNHKCKFVDHQTEIKHFDASLEHWNIKRSKWHNHLCSIKKKGEFDGRNVHFTHVR